MPVNKIIAIAVAAIAAMLIIYAGKSCASNIQETNRKNSAEHSSNASVDYNSNGAYTIDPAFQYADETAAPSEENFENVQVVTNLFGEVVATIPAESVTAEQTETTENVSSESTQEESSHELTDAPEPETTSPQSNGSADHPLLGNIESKTAASEPTEYKPPAPSSTDFVIHVY